MARKFQGPVPPGASVEVFRETGKVVPARPGDPGFIGPVRPKFQGPIRPGTSERGFRGTGFSESFAQSMAREESARQRSQAEAQQRKSIQTNQQIANQIEKERQRQLFLANQKYQQDLKTIHSQAMRIERNNKLQQQIANIQTQSRLARVEKGIVDKTIISFTTGDVVVTSNNLSQVKARLGLGKKPTPPPKKGSVISATKP